MKRLFLTSSSAVWEPGPSVCFVPPLLELINSTGCSKVHRFVVVVVVLWYSRRIVLLVVNDNDGSCRAKQEDDIVIAMIGNMIMNRSNTRSDPILTFLPDFMNTQNIMISFVVWNEMCMQLRTNIYFALCILTVAHHCRLGNGKGTDKIPRTYPLGNNKDARQHYR
jgi:hypothetical protein